MTMTKSDECVAPHLSACRRLNRYRYLALTNLRNPSHPPPVFRPPFPERTRAAEMQLLRESAAKAELVLLKERAAMAEKELLAEFTSSQEQRFLDEMGAVQVRPAQGCPRAGVPTRRGAHALAAGRGLRRGPWAV